MLNIKEQMKSDIQAAIAARVKGGNLIFGYLGMPGVGKTQIVAQVAEELRLRHFGALLLSSCSPMDIVGKVPNVEEEVLASYPNSDIPLDIFVGDEFVLWPVDECTNATSDTWKAFQQGMLSRQFGKHRLGKNVIILLMGNRQSDKAGSGVLSTAVYNRVTWRNIEWTAKHSDTAIEYISDKYREDSPQAKETLALMQGYFTHKPILEKDFTDALGKIGKDAYVQWCSPRSLEALLCRVSVTGWVLPGVEDMAGDIGLGRATELMGFASLLGKLPKYEEIIKDPAKCKLPEEVDAQYAMVSMLSVRVKPTDMELVWSYMSRFKETTMRVVFLKMATKVTRELTDTKTYKDLFKTDKELVAAVSSM